MRVFMSRMTDRGSAEHSQDRLGSSTPSSSGIAELEALAEAACDEEVLAR
jgi:hypothetical protein